MVIIKQDSSPKITYILGFFVLLFIALIIFAVFYVDKNRVFSIVLFMCMFFGSSVSFWLNTFPKIILSDTDITIQTLWPWNFPLTYTFKISDVEAVIIAKTKYLPDFLSNNQVFEKIVAISKDTLKETLCRERGWFDRDPIIARILSNTLSSNEYYPWLCIIKKDSTLFMTPVANFSENISKLQQSLSEKSIKTIYKLKDVP